MKRLCLLLILATAALIPMAAQKSKNPFAGRCDITTTAHKGSYRDWMELADENGTPAVRIQPRGGSVHPAAAVKMDGSHLLITVSAATARAPELTWDLTVSQDRLTGTQKRGDATAQIAGVRAPALKRSAPKAWSAPESFFNGEGLSDWEHHKPEINHCMAKDRSL